MSWADSHCFIILLNLEIRSSRLPALDMPKVNPFQINLQKQVPIFMSGETINGTVSYRINERFKANGVYVEASGNGHVRW